MLFPRNILFESRRRDLERGLVGDSIMRYIVNLNTGLFCGSPVRTYVLVYGGRGHDALGGGVVFVGTLGRIAQGGTRDCLRGMRVRGVMSTCFGTSRVRGFDAITSLRRVTGCGCGLGVSLCTGTLGGRGGFGILSISRALDG